MEFEISCHTLKVLIGIIFIKLLIQIDLYLIFPTYQYSKYACAPIGLLALCRGV